VIKEPDLFRLFFLVPQFVVNLLRNIDKSKKYRYFEFPMVKSGISLKQLKEQNRISILQVVRNHGPISRAELARILGLSYTACIDLTREYIAKGLIHEKGPGNSSGGRKPMLLEINWDYCYIIGFILSADGVSCGIFNLGLDKTKILIRRMDLSGKRIDRIVKEYTLKLVEESGIPISRIAGMTLGVGGVVDSLKGNIISSSHLHTKETIHIRESLEGFFLFPIYLENYVNLMAFAEKRLFYPGYNSLALLQVENGIGSGVIRGDAILRGTYGYANEIGHISIDRKGPLCFCGNRGCIETLGKIPALLERAEAALKSGKKSRIKLHLRQGAVTIQSIAEALKENDQLAWKLFEDEADILFHAVQGIILTSDPDIIILSGDITVFGQLLIDRISSKIEKTVYSPALKNRIITFSQLKQPPRVQGAGMYAIECFFNIFC
jgi:predicted NBD/HSP70 family sugar kinase